MKKTLLFSGLCLLSHSLYAQSSPASSELNDAFVAHDYSKVSAIAQNHPSPQNTEILSEWANKGSVPAMWLYAKQLYNDGKEQDSANWIYTAVLGLRLDISGCANNEVSQVEKDFLNAYWGVVQAARVMPTRMATAIDYSIRFYQKNNLTTIDPVWVCRFKPEWNHQGLSLKEPVWSAHRKWIYNDYIRASSAQGENQDQGDMTPLSNHDMMKELRNSEGTSN